MRAGGKGKGGIWQRGRVREGGGLTENTVRVTLNRGFTRHRHRVDKKEGEEGGAGVGKAKREREALLEKF